jgi:hypothetical protein
LICYYGIVSTETVPANKYTAEQAEVLRLHELYRRCLLDQKYWAHMLARYKFWDRLTGIVTAVSSSSAVGGMAVFRTGWGDKAFTTLGAVSALVLVIRPFFKLSESVERYSKLHYGFTALFYQIENLVADIRRNNGMDQGHRTEADKIVERFNNLMLLEDASVSQKMVAGFQDEVDTAIPGDSLWLPG